MKIILIVIIFLLNILMIFPQDTNDQKEILKQILRSLNLNSKFPSAQDNIEFQAYDQRIESLKSSKEKFTDTLKFNCKFEIDVDKDGSNDVKENLELAFNKLDEKYSTKVLNAFFDFEKNFLGNENYAKIIFKKSSVRLSAKITESNEDESFSYSEIEASGVLNYKLDSDIKCEFILNGKGSGMDAFILKGKMIINNKEYELNLNLTDLTN